MACSGSRAAAVPGLTVDRITVGGFHTCALSAAGAATCWGANYNGSSASA